jgi:hypothetical protein
MSAHRRIPLQSRAEWEYALAGIPHAIGHTWGHCRSIELSSGVPTHLYCYEAGTTRVVCPLAERRFRGEPDVVTPYGFGGFVGTGDCSTFPARWTEYAARSGYVCGYIGLHPVLSDTHGYPAGTVQAHNSVFVLDLTRTADQLIAGMDTNRRRQLRAPTAGVRMVWDRSRLQAFFVATYPQFVRRAGAAPVYHFGAETLASLCALENVFLVGAEVDGALEAVMVFGHTPELGEYLFGVALPEGRRHAARLLWCGIERLRSLGVPRVNLGGGARPGDGIAEFKRRFGARELPLPALRQVYRPETFDALCSAAGVSPDVDGYFPPYHSPGLQP